MKLGFSGQIFEKYLDIKFHDSPFSRNRVTCGQTYMMKLIVVFRNFANAHEGVATCTFPNTDGEGIIIHFVSSLFTCDSSARGPITEAAHACIKCIPSLVCTPFFIALSCRNISKWSDYNVIYIIIAFFGIMNGNIVSKCTEQIILKLEVR